MRSIYDNVAITQSLAPQSVAGSSAVNGLAVDTKGFVTAMLSAYAGVTSSNPSVATMTYKIQESATSGGTYTDALDNTGTVIGGVATVNAAAASVVARIEGLGLNRKRFLRIVVTPAFTGGTSPASLLDGQIILGRAFQLPTTTAVSNT